MEKYHYWRLIHKNPFIMLDHEQYVFKENLFASCTREVKMIFANASILSKLILSIMQRVARYSCFHVVKPHIK